MDRITLTGEKETLLIPLYGKARENEKASPVLVDKKAVEIVKQIDYDFKTLRIPEKTNIMMCIRAKLIDDFVRGFLSTDNDSVVLHLGCGLDSRYDRVGNSVVEWYDLDFKEVMDIRKYFYNETGHYHFIPSSVMEEGWLKELPEGKRQYMVAAEGLFMYLKEEGIKTLVSRLKERIGSYTLVFDAYSRLTAKHAKSHPSLKKTGAVIQWGIDNPQDLVKWGIGIQAVEERYFTSNDIIGNLSAGTRFMFRTANLFPAARRAHRLLICKIC